jgi:hypothetical protein
MRQTLLVLQSETDLQYQSETTDEYTALMESWLAGINQSSQRKTFLLATLSTTNTINDLSYGMAMEMC